MADRLLLRGGSVISMDPKVGDLPKGDVLIEGDKIAQIAPNIQADAQVIDVTGDVVIPGFIDSHRHTWECAIRGCAPNATLDDYFVEVLDTFAPIYRPEDVYASNLAGALECINAGITTLLDWSHINNTPEHPDAGIRGLTESGIRAVYAYGSANLSLNDYWNQSKIAIPKDDVRRVRDKYFSSPDGLLTMQLATRGPGFCMDDVCTQEWTFARELGLPITVHVGMGRLAGRFAMIKQLQRLNLLGSDTTYIHCCYFNDEEWQLVKDTGGKNLDRLADRDADGPRPATDRQSAEARAAAQPLDRRRDHRAGRHVHQHAQRVRVRTRSGECRRLGSEYANPREHPDRAGRPGDGHHQRRLHGRSGRSHWLADSGQAGRCRRH